MAYVTIGHASWRPSLAILPKDHSQSRISGRCWWLILEVWLQQWRSCSTPVEANQHYCISGGSPNYSWLQRVLTSDLHSPACILSFILVASVRGELKQAWSWTEMPEEKKVDVDSLPEAIPVVNANGGAQTSGPTADPAAVKTANEISPVTVGSEGEGSNASRPRARTRQQTTKGRA